jgi:hypothetical protein
MTPHDHATFVPGCFRCELSRDEVVGVSDTGGMHKPPVWIDVRRLRELHARRLSAWGIPSDPEDDYATAVVERILQYQRELDDEPQAHPHQHEEMGMCLECDAAAVLESWREESDQEPSTDSEAD